MKAIPTKYGKIQFRSRLEAKWAALFDKLGWHWTYEPFDLDGYIPDFLLQFEKRQALVEVKPVASIGEAQNAFAAEKMQRAREEWDDENKDFLLVGAARFDQSTWDRNATCMGVMQQGSHPEDAAPRRYDYSNECLLGWCNQCGEWIYIDMLMLWVCPGCENGGKEVTQDLVAEWMFDGWWGEAGNEVQWRKP